MIRVISSYAAASIAVGRDFLVFGEVIKDFIRDYSRATIAVTEDLWQEFAPRKTLFTPLTSLVNTPGITVPTLPSLPVLTNFLQEEPDDAWQTYAFVITPIVFFLGSSWFMVMLVFVGD